MVMAVSQRLNSFLGASREMRPLLGKAKVLATLQRHYETIAPPALAKHSQVLWMERGILTLSANNGAIAAKLRQLAPDLAMQLRDKGCEVTSIHIKVQVSPKAEVHQPKAAKLSATDRQHFAELAAHLPDSPLKQALQRIARHEKG